MKYSLITLALGTGLGLTGLTSVVQALPSVHLTLERSIAQSTFQTPSQSTAQPEWYNCLTREVWSPEKQAWCDKVQQLQNATFAIPNYGTVTLTNGQYENTEQRFRVSLINKQGLIAFGDVNGDGTEDAAVMLDVNSGGSGMFVYLTVVPRIGQAPQPLEPLEAVLLGDRVTLNSLSIADQAITLNMVTQGPNDPMCCPTQEVTRIYTVQPALVQTGGDPATPMPLPAPLPNRSSGSGSGSSSNAVPPENATTASVTGTITYLQRIALPPNARVEVKLQDVSRQDAPAQTLATQIIPLEGRQVPIPFELVYSPEQIDASHTYAVQARILVDDQLWFITTSRYAVLTQGNPTRIDLMVERTPSRSPQ